MNSALKVPEEDLSVTPPALPLGDLASVPPRVWKDSEGRRFSDEHVLGWVNKTRWDKDHEYQVIVGTDSHMHGRTFRFITVACVYKVGKGGNYFYVETYEPRESYTGNQKGNKRIKGNQKMRMFTEVAKSLEIAEFLVERASVIPVVHIDASPSTLKHFTSSFSDQLKGYVMAAGFECVLKPESYVANAVADKHTK